MSVEQIYNLCKGIQPFIKFDVEIKPKQVISCIGFEYVCANPQCDCQLVHVAVYQEGQRKRLAFIIYGWHDYSYYAARKHTVSEAMDLAAGVLSDAEPETEANKAILEEFRRWLSKDKAGKNQIFAARYEQYKLAARKTYTKRRNAKLEKLFSLMYELFGEAKVEEFIAGCDRSMVTNGNVGDQPANVSNIADFKSKSKSQR